MFCTINFSCHILCAVLKYGVTHTQQSVNVCLCYRKSYKINLWSHKNGPYKYAFYDQHILKLPDVVKLKTPIIMFRRFTIFYRLMYSHSSA